MDIQYNYIDLGGQIYDNGKSAISLLLHLKDWKKKGDKGKSANSFPYDLRERLIRRYVEISASKYVEIQKNQGW